eukprot:2166920-Rhodomonas_salina.2
MRGQNCATKCSRACHPVRRASVRGENAPTCPPVRARVLCHPVLVLRSPSSCASCFFRSRRRGRGLAAWRVLLRVLAQRARCTLR